MSINWDQSDRPDPAYNPTAREERAQEAAENAEGARREFRALADRHAQEALALAKKFEIEPEGSWVKWAQDRKKTFATLLAETLAEAMIDMHNLPDPDDAFAEVMGDD